MSGIAVRVLVVEDDEDDFVLARDLLAESKELSCTLTWRTRFDEALAELRTCEYDAALVDYRLGERDGVDFIRAATEGGCRTPVVMLTGAGDQAIDREAMQAGAADYLPKTGLDRARLERAVLHAIERSRQFAALRESEERFRTLADSTPVFIWMTDEAMRLAYVNKRWRDFAGREEACGEQSWVDDVHPDDWERLSCTFQEAFDRRAEFQGEFRLRNRHGAYRWLLSIGVPRFTDDGRFLGYVGSCVDFTERKLAEQALADARNYARGIIDSSLDMIISVDTQRRIVEFNRAAEEGFGYARKEIVGRPVKTLYAGESDADRVQEMLQREGRFSGEVENVRRNGERFTAYLSASLLRSVGGEILGVMGVSRDITELKRAQHEQAEAHALVARSREDMREILNQLRMGIVMTDENGGVAFLSQGCQRLLNTCEEDFSGAPWEELCPFGEEDKARLHRLFETPPAQREKLAARMRSPNGRSYYMDVEVHDDPRDSRRKIIFLYDMTEVHDLRQMLDEKHRFGGMVGKCDAMRSVFELITQLSTVDSTVLIEGETGTGKELAARAIHAGSARADKPFVAVNCAGLTESLLGSQLFGHKRGSFTGAVADQIGVFETADGGTIFLDEIGDISPGVQSALLRVMQEKEITRIGDTQPRKVDVRVIAATHRDLRREVEEGRFRQDLLYRIRVARIHLPPLRERRADIPLLAQTFLHSFRTQTGRAVETIRDDAQRLLVSHDWPGNVRELQSAVEFAVIRSTNAVITPADLPPEIARPSAPLTPRPEPSELDERGELLEALTRTHGNRVEAARLLGVSRATLYRRLARHHIDAE